jgi:inosine-uridine nucleoside N-ribohydrolase
MEKKIPVILDTDIGTDIDDTWALAMILRSPELDLKLVTTETGDTTYRAKLVAKMLEVVGRSDIPVGVGPATTGIEKTIEPWVADYDLDRYPGKVYPDGTEALIQTIMASPEPITIIAIGPVPTLAKALKREPRIAARSRLVGMFGSVRKGYQNSPEIAAEYNVKTYVPECQKVFTAPWEITITPLDTCGLIYLKGENFKKVRDCHDPLIQTLMENYSIWKKTPFGKERAFENLVESSCLYDTVAVYLAFSEDLVEMERLGIRVDDEGFTRIDPKAKNINCAMNWKSLEGFETFLRARLIGLR